VDLDCGWCFFAPGGSVWADLGFVHAIRLTWSWFESMRIADFSVFLHPHFPGLGAPARCRRSRKTRGSCTGFGHFLGPGTRLDLVIV